MDEFDLIDQFFRPLGGAYARDEIGIGDDAAVLNVTLGEQLLVTTDTQIESVHFPAGADASLIGYRSCATSLSDIAAMGGAARWATLAIAVPQKDAHWLAAFAEGAADALKLDNTALVGGDTTAGPLTISWTILGSVLSGAAIRRDGAQVDDDIYVSGKLGGASAALDFIDQANTNLSVAHHALVQSYWRPQPRLALGRALQSIATSCVDISDGLLADLAHITRASKTGAHVQIERLPINEQLSALFDVRRAQDLALGGGDDYELCFSASSDYRREINTIAQSCEVEITRIGRITGENGVEVFDRAGKLVTVERLGYRHFE